MSSSTRLHISGLTPSISAQDINSKLSSFGNVQALDGFGALDANGDPRKFAYATLEAQPTQVSKCVNTLSGTTWKGARLRLAPAKPDFAARWSKEHDAASAEPPPAKRRKRLRGAHGRECGDMAPVTPESAPRHPGWRTTPLGHLVHPVRMRPARPLPPPPGEQGKEKETEKKKKKKVKVRPVPTRARRRLLDPTRWGATHLSGALLENAVVSELAQRRVAVEASSSSVDDEDEDEENDAAEAAAPSKALDAISTTLRDEASQSRKLLDALFAGTESDDWRARDAIDSDLEELVQKLAPSADAAPMTDEEDADESMDDEDDEPEDEPPAAQPVQTRSLKEMFAPREEEAGFSLMAHLDLGDLELDDDLALLAAPAPVPAPTPAPLLAPVVAVPAQSADEWRIAADAPGVRPLFFPVSFNAHGFYRTETDEQIRARWEERKGALTADWKKRAREAKKRGRRGGAGADE